MFGQAPILSSSAAVDAQAPSTALINHNLAQESNSSATPPESINNESKEPSAKAKDKALMEKIIKKKEEMSRQIKADRAINNANYLIERQKTFNSIREQIAPFVSFATYAKAKSDEAKNASPNQEQAQSLSLYHNKK